MSRWFLIRAERSCWEVWASSPLPDDLEAFLHICRENWVGNFEILPEFELEAQRDKIQAKDYVTYFR
jgi:hypothetical protein